MFLDWFTDNREQYQYCAHKHYIDHVGSKLVKLGYATEVIRQYLHEGFALITASASKIKMTDRTLRESDSLGLSFNSHDDALDYVGKLVKRGNDFLAVQELSIAENYRRGVMVIQFELDSITSGRSEQYHLVFAATPSRGPRKLKSASSPMTAAEARTLSYGYDWSNNSMLVGVVDLVKSPKKSIPSFVWLTPANQASYFFRDAFPQTFQVSVKVCFGVADGKVKSTTGLSADSVHGLIKSAAKVTDRVNCVSKNIRRQRFIQSNLKKIVKVLRISISESGVSVFVVNEISDFPFKFGKMILSRPCNRVP
jgi:hypothetical protein